MTNKKIIKIASLNYKTRLFSVDVESKYGKYIFVAYNQKFELVEETTYTKRNIQVSLEQDIWNRNETVLSVQYNPKYTTIINLDVEENIRVFKELPQISSPLLTANINDEGY